MSKGGKEFDHWFMFRVANVMMVLTGKLFVMLVRGIVAGFAEHRAQGLVEKRSRMIRMGDGQGKGGLRKW